jgi:hypothetical protein
LVLTRASGSKGNFLHTMIDSIINFMKFLLNHPSTFFYVIVLMFSVAVLNIFTLKFSHFLFARRDF